jgi:acid phosphatase
MTLLLVSCAPPVDEFGSDMGIAWVRNSAEYQALSRQVYRSASLALPGMIADQSWSALPQQTDAASLPPAIILDIDETALTNAGFQAALVPPFRDDKLTNWSQDNTAIPVPGAVNFVQLAVDSGVAVFFLTNRPCEKRAGIACPQKSVVVDDLVEAGFPASDANVTLSYERPEWSKEKSIRRNLIAADYRVIMLIGDDLGDFIPCTRKRPLEPCDAGATRTSRKALVEEHADYWGNGWYVLPNPMHGSWTGVSE